MFFCRIALSVALALAALAGSAAAAAAPAGPAGAAVLSHPDYRVTAAAVRQAGPLALVEETVQAGADPLARFTVHRVFRPAAARRGALLLMPPGGSNFDFYTASEDGDARRSFAAFLALRGFEVWGYSPRTRGLALGACAGEADCSGLGAWGMGAFVADGLYVRERMRAFLGEEKPVVGGYSLGAMAALAMIDARPGDWAGALLLDGMLYSDDPEVQAANRTVCDGLEELLAAGVLWDDATYPFVRLLHELAVAQPAGPTFIPGFPAGTTNLQAYVALLSAPAPAPPGYVPGYTLAAAGDGGLLSSLDRLGLYFLGVNDYDPLALVRDYTCGLAGERTFTGNLAAFTGPVLALGVEHGFGPWMGGNLALLGSADVRWSVAPGLGHLDLFASEEHREQLEKPVLRWLREVLER